MRALPVDKTIYERYEEGLNYIYLQNEKEWKDTLLYRYNEDGNCEVVDVALTFMKSLDKGEDIAAQYTRCKAYKLSDDFFAKVLKIVAKFSKRGVEFYYWAVEYRFARLVCGREEKQIIKIAMKNRKFEQEINEEIAI